VNYFDYNANKYRPKGESSKTAYVVLDAPAEWRVFNNYWVTEHGEVTREMWDALTPVKL
jgi:hypothetical protein